jgi:hypothetical protein
VRPERTARPERTPRLTRAQRRDQRRRVKEQDHLVPGAWAFWRAGWRLLLRRRATLAALAIVIAIDVGVFASGLGGDHRAAGIAANALAWLVVTIAALRMPVLGLRQLLSAAGASAVIVALTTLPGRLGIVGALVGAFLGAVPGLLWRGAPLVSGTRSAAVLLVRRLAGAVLVFVVLVIAPLVVAILVASEFGYGSASDIEHAGDLVRTMLATLMVVSIGPMYAAMAQWLSVVRPTPAGLPTVERDAFAEGAP